MSPTAETAAVLKRTPFYEIHKELGARIVPFAGYEMPVQYTGLIDEHQTVRTAAGLFDVAHMGIATVRGSRAKAFLNHALTRDLQGIEPGHASYSLLCRPDGGTVDDLIVYCEDEEDFYLVLNASNKEKDLHYLIELNQAGKFGCEIASLFDSYSLIALQGPRAQAILEKLGSDFRVDTPFRFASSSLGKLPIQVKLASTGYTGEAGCEIFVHNSLAKALWREIMQEGAAFGLKAIGLGARDTLRTEMGYSLYGHELGETINPIEAGLKWAVGLAKSDFIGKAALEKAVAAPKRKLVCFKNASKQAPRPDMKVFDSQGRECGAVSSGTFAPSLGYSIGMALVAAESTPPYSVDIRGSKVAFEPAKRPFYKKAEASGEKNKTIPVKPGDL